MVSPPVTSHPEFLPLDDPNLSWERFEAFCEELISRLPGVKETHRYGRRGSRQRGIDIFADLDNGERWAFQCRQWKKFTKTDATRAIRGTSYKADRYILTLSLQATSGVRDACDSHPAWDVWDVGDISRKVREMEMQSSARLVEAHFGPFWRRAFLGLQSLTPFVGPTDFFRPFLNDSALFNHAWKLVGRSDHIQQIHEVVESQQQNVAVLVGRGGIGKSKMLHALAETFDSEHEGMPLWFMADGVPLTANGADHLPYESCAIVVDDAHRRGDLPALLALSRQRPHVTKLILSCRPQAIDHVRSQLTHGGFDVQEVVVLPEVKELSRKEVTELGRQALGAEFANLADQLATVTWDCPLVTVVGGQLLAKKDISPELLERDEEFRGTVLTRFGDILVGKIEDRIDPKLCRSLLDLTAAIQPIRLDNEKALDFQAEFLGMDRPGLIRSLGVLEQAGVLLRRGYTLRIVPDVLADHILHQASVTLQGQRTGYADQIFDKFGPLCPSEDMRNLSELDWRLRRSDAQASDVLSGIWQSIEQEFRDASNMGRCIILGILEEVAMYQPEKTLELVEYAIQNPATKSEDSDLARVYEYTHGDVLVRLPPLLRRVSYTLDFLPRCCHLLWELGRDDDRDLNPHPDHAMRVLADMASYQIGKPFVVNHLVLDALEKLLESPGSHDHVHSPLDVIDPMLAKTGVSTHSEGHNLVSRSFVLKEEDIKSIRQRSLSLVYRCLSSDSLKVSLRSLVSLENALREPFRAFNHEVSEEDREQWRSEQLEILTQLESLAQHSAEPVILLRIREVLWWHRRYSPSNDVKRRAGFIASSAPESLEFRLTRELMDPFHKNDWWPDIEDEVDKYRLRDEEIEQIQRTLAAELSTHSGDPGEAYKTLADRIQALNGAGVQPRPETFLGILADSDPEFAAELCDIIVEDHGGALAPYLQPLLANVRRCNPKRARSLTQRALESGSNILCRGVALSYQSRGWADNATEQDVENIRELLDHKDMDVRIWAIGSLGVLAEAKRRTAIDLAKDVEIGDTWFLASALCRIFYGGWIPLRELTTDDLRVLLSKLEDVQQIDDWDIKIFLVEASRLDSRAVVELLMNRIKRQNKQGAIYSALPPLGFQDPQIGLSTSPDQEGILRDVRDTVLESGWSVKYWTPQLFREVSSDFESPASLKVLNEWINSGCASMIESAAHLISGAKPSFVFTHLDFVSNLLARAHAVGHDCYQSATSSLAGSALSGIRSGLPGQPMPEDVATRDQATTIAARFAVGSPQHMFYARIAESAKTSIREQLLRDEERIE